MTAPTAGVTEVACPVVGCGAAVYVTWTLHPTGKVDRTEDGLELVHEMRLDDAPIRNHVQLLHRTLT